MKKLIIGLILFFYSLFASATCSHFYHDGIAPAYPVQNNTFVKEICFTKFVVIYNTMFKIPLVSAQLLTLDDIIKSEQIGRRDAFHEEIKLYKDFRSTLDDYKNSGYDRGHLTPSNDAPTYVDQYHTFSLANIVPQTAASNRIVWKGVEERLHEYMKLRKIVSAYVITGAIVTDNVKTTVGKSKIRVPEFIYKAVYFNHNKIKPIVYVTENKPDTKMLLL